MWQGTVVVLLCCLVGILNAQLPVTKIIRGYGYVRLRLVVAITNHSFMLAMH